MNEITYYCEPLVSEITEYAEFVDIKAAWNSILLKRSHASVFLMHEWIDAAWQWCKFTGMLRLLCCYQGADLVAVAPLFATKSKKYFVSYSQLSIIQVPDTQECDIVASDHDSSCSVDSMIGYLSNQTDWDIAVFSKLQSDSHLAAHIGNACKKRDIRFVSVESEENIEVNLTSDWDSYYSARSRRLRKSNNNCRNKIFADGSTVTLHWLQDARSDEAETERLLSSVKYLSSISWKKHTGRTLDNVGPGGFIDRLSEHATQNNWLSLWALDIDNVIVACEYQLVYEGVVVALRADYDPSFASISPGSYLNWQILEGLFASDNSLYRMGVGKNSYKLRWANSHTALKEVRLYNRTMKGLFFWVMEERVKPVLRRLRNAISMFPEHLPSFGPETK